MEYARESLSKLAERLNLSKENQDTTLDIVNEFLRKNKEWNESHIGKLPPTFQT